jgi:hypothetical protein
MEKEVRQKNIKPVTYENISRTQTTTPPIQPQATTPQTNTPTIQRQPAKTTIPQKTIAKTNNTQTKKTQINKTTPTKKKSISYESFSSEIIKDTPPLKKVPEKKIITKTTPAKKPPAKPQIPARRRKPRYGYAGKEPIEKILRKTIPEQLIPTKKMAAVMGWVFLGVVLIALLKFPLGEMLSGNMDATIEVGWPLIFLELTPTNPERFPVNPKNLIIDILFYIVLAYLIDITLTIMLKSSYLRPKKERKGIPKTFSAIKKESIADRATKKLFGKPKIN